MKHYHKNPRQITKKQYADLQDSLKRLGDLSGIVHDLSTDEVIGGNQRMDVFDLKTAQIELTEKLDQPDEQGTVARGFVLWQGKKYSYRAVMWDDKTREEANIRANKAGGSWDFDVLANEFEVPDLIEWGFDPAELGVVDEPEIGESETQDEARKTLADRFIVPPFSVLDARQGYWQERKRAWIAQGIESELGRGGGGVPPPHPPTITQNPDGTLNYTGTAGQAARFDKQRQPNAAPGGSLRPAATLGKDGHTLRGDGKGRGLARCYGQDIMKGENPNFENRLTWVAGNRPEGELDEVSRKILAAQPSSGTSIFDPVLCELVYRWFCPPSGSILDPFAGGSVRGVVASLLGHPYTGIDLRPEQIEANEAQARAICKGAPPRWITGDSRNIHSLITEGAEYDLVFSCPPYFDLELYSEDDKDLSNAGEYSAFIEAYNDIVAQAVARLKHNRFACFVVGDIRDKAGFYRDFVSDTIRAFQDAGAMLYNEAILVTSVGSLPIRVGRQFQGYRKLGKTHQNVLVFYKGDPRKIKEFGEVEAGDIAEAAED